MKNKIELMNNPINNENAIIMQLSVVGIIGNILLTAFKLFAGIIGNSGAMVSDAIHSLSDVFATFIAFVGVKISKCKPDKAHPYGHERIECVASLVLGLILLLTGLGIGKASITTIIAGHYDKLTIPSMIALVAAFVSIITKEAMFWYTIYYAKILNSTAFVADAWHHRSDAISSIGALIGIGGAMLGFPIFDSVASLLICLLILKVAFDILKDSIVKMLDTSCDDVFEKELLDFIVIQTDVIGVDKLHTRMFGNKVYVDLEIKVDGNKTLKEAHAIAEHIHDTAENKFSSIKHIMIHLNPA